MATPTVSDSPEVNSNYATHVALTAALLATLRRLWPQVDPRRLQEAVAAVVAQFSRASISLNAEHYEVLRDQAGVVGRFTVPVVDPLSDDSLRAYLAAVAPNGLVALEGASQKLVMDAGRNELLAAIEADTQARGWARVTRAGGCSFCLMLATRGAVYKSDETAGFEAHTNCHCTVEPVFGIYEPPAHVRSAQALWSESTDGLHGQDAINAFRRAVERGN